MSFTNQSALYSLQANRDWIGRVLLRISLAWFRYFNSNSGLCSVKLASDCGLPASSSATLSPASARRLEAHPPEAPEPTTITSYSGLLLFCTRPIPFFPRGMVTSAAGNGEDYSRR